MADEQKPVQQPNFKGKMSGILDGSGWLMNKIENGGFLVLFLIQDFFGMTVPRSIAGFLRDKEETGEYNIQEGFEVLGREGLTGPCMMAVAPACLWLTSKYSKTSSVNTELIKRFGNSLKEMVSEPGFDDKLLKNSEAFKSKFYERNIRQILSDTLGKENVTKESVDYIMKQIKNYENIPADAKLEKFRGKSKYRAQCMDNIVKHINNLKYKTSSELEMLEKVKFGSDKLKDKMAFKTTNAFDGMMKYASDAITANKKLEKLNGTIAESFKHKALGKRILVNIGMIAATLGVLSVLPKIYARSNTAPGARKENKENNNQQVAFKGKGSITEKIGKAVEKRKGTFASSELEYNGYNFTNTLMAGLSIFGLLTPRCLRAYSRAQTDENGKKDLTELWEIILRDITSSLSVVFAVPILTRLAVSSYENKSGFVLMNKDRTQKGWKTAFDLINPYSKAHVLSNAELSALYENVDSKAKMLNFCKYIDKNGGDLEKILSKSEEFKSVFNENTVKMEKLKGKTKAETNKNISNFIENIEKHVKTKDKKSVDELIKKLMNGVKSGGGRNKIASLAKGLNSVPGLLTTFFISPYILGWFIPRLTYANTRRIHAKEDREREQKLKANA